MPYTAVSDISPGAIVEGTGRTLEIKVGRGLIGKVIDPLGHSIDHTILTKRNGDSAGLNKNLLIQWNDQQSNEPIDVGVRVIDSLLTVGKGQRVGIFAGSGVGKSTLLGMVATKYDS